MSDGVDGRPGGTPMSGQRPWWRQAFSLKIEIALAFGVVIALMLALGVAFHLSEQRSAFALDKLLKVDGRMADLSLRSQLAMLRAGGIEADFLLAADRFGVVEARERYALPLQSHLLDMREYLTSIRVLSADPAFLDGVGQIEQLVQQYEARFLAFVDLYGRPGQVERANLARQEFKSAAGAIEPLLEALHTTASRRAIQTLNDVESAANITRRTVFVTVCVAALLGVAVALLLSRRISGSVLRLIDFSERVAAGDFAARTQQAREHEFAILARAMNQMAQSLENSQTKLLAAARQAGMAEIATNVLHNVGNILNSVNVSANLIGDKLRASKAQGLAKAVQLMRERGGDLGDFLTLDEKGRLLPAYLEKLSQALAAEQVDMIEELGQLHKSIEHIKGVVATQQSYAGNSSVLESVRIGDLIADALRINDGAAARHPLTLVTECADVPPVRLDKTRVMQILVNLIGNARQAMEGVGEAPRRMTLRVALVGPRLRICVKDEGEGIPAHNLARIFQHGFTTRKGGHGFGLHSCALAAQEMGGTLTAQSDGPGLGALFTLELPLLAEQKKRDRASPDIA